MTAFIHEDGLGNMMDEDGKDVVMLESDIYMDLKPPERTDITKTKSNDKRPSKASAPNRKTYRC
ncbi:hypothetical protein BX666DRAFT_1997458 [Dichotomocladium elegans]|nr:hypothetical protein BX666DRAFT_1997458 [Dichotomocladium elegans]